MTLFVVLLLIALAYAAYHFRSEISSLLSRVQKAKDPASQTPSPSPQAPVAPAQVDTGTDNPFTRAYAQSNPQYVDVKPGDSGPGVSQVDGIGNVTFVEGGVGQNVIINGPGERYLTIPEGFTGTVCFEVAQNPSTKYPYSVYLDGSLVGTAITDGVVSKEIPVNAGERHTLRIDQGDSSVTAEFRAYRKG